MTVLDEEFLGVLLKDAATAFSVPGRGVDDILDRASGRPAIQEDEAPTLTADTDDIAPHSFRRHKMARSGRLLVAAACLVVAFVVAAGATWLWKAPAAQRSASSQPSSGSLSLKIPPTHQGATAAGETASSAPSAANSAAGSSVGASGLVGEANSGATAVSTPAASSTGKAAPALPSGEVGQSSKIEQTGSLTLIVPNGSTSKTMSELTFLAGTFDGFVVSSQTQAVPGSAGGARAGSITLQVPVASFATVVKKAKALGKTASLTTKATDVTGQYVDLQSQITALQASLQQYLTIMTKATTIGDILSVQTQINTIQSQIQQLQGQLQVLDTETTYSTLTVQVRQKTVPPPVVPIETQSGVAKAWHDSMHGFADGAEGLIRLSGPALFVLVCGGVLFFAVRFGWRRYRRPTCSPRPKSRDGGRRSNPRRGASRETSPPARVGPSGVRLSA